MHKSDIIPALLVVGFVAGGMFGLASSIPYSGWVLACGLILAMFRDWGEQEDDEDVDDDKD